MAIYCAVQRPRLWPAIMPHTMWCMPPTSLRQALMRPCRHLQCQSEVAAAGQRGSDAEGHQLA